MVRFKKLPRDEFYAHQRYIIDQLEANPSKSLAMFYSPGTGKTGPAAYAALHHPTAKLTVYMGPKSLHNVFRHHIKRLGGDPGARSVTGAVKFPCITSSASNVYKQWMEAVEPILGKDSTKAKGMIERDERGEPIIEKAEVFLIIDEAHQFSTRVAGILQKLHYSSDDEVREESEFKEAYKLYRYLTRDTRVQVLALTGTPIQNHPFNSVPLFNILRKEFAGPDGRRALAFPEVYTRFYNSYIRNVVVSGSAPTGLLPRQKGEGEEVVEKADIDRSKARGEVFAMRIRGLCAWFEAPKGLEGVPIATIGSNKIISVPMSTHQWTIYRKMEDSEKRIETALRKDLPERSEGTPLVDSKSVYKSLTRQASNFAFEEEMYEGTKKTGEEMLKASGDEVFYPPSMGNDGIVKHSCKMVPIIEDIVNLSDRIHGIFTHHVKGAGIAAFERVFKVMGWHSLNTAIKSGVRNFTEAEIYFRRESGGKKGVSMYAVLTGDESPEIRSKVIEIFNDKANTTKLLTRVVLYSEAASHGLTFKSGRKIHIFEPPWDVNDGEQAVLRWIRLMASSWLPPSDRVVDIAWYIADFPKEFGGKGQETTDAHILNVSIRKSRLNDWVIDWIKASCINCHGQFLAENALHAELIKANTVPPTRTFFRCMACNAIYQPSFFIQELGDSKCKHVGRDMPPIKSLREVKGGDKKTRYLLDPATGLGWMERTVVEGKAPVISQMLDPYDLQDKWRTVLKKK